MQGAFGGADLLWMPRHSDILGNEKADRLVKKYSVGVRPTHCSVGIPSCYLDELDN